MNNWPNAPINANAAMYINTSGYMVTKEINRKISPLSTTPTDKIMEDLENNNSSKMSDWYFNISSWNKITIK